MRILILLLVGFLFAGGHVTSSQAINAGISHNSVDLGLPIVDVFVQHQRHDDRDDEDDEDDEDDIRTNAPGEHCQQWNAPTFQCWDARGHRTALCRIRNNQNVCRVGRHLQTIKTCEVRGQWPRLCE